VFIKNKEQFSEESVYSSKMDISEKRGYFKKVYISKKWISKNDTLIFPKMLHSYRVKLIINGNDLEKFEFDGRKKFC